MVFWKEWLKDVCGRSAMFFVRVYSAPKDNSIIKLSSRNARIHITVNPKYFNQKKHNYYFLAICTCHCPRSSAKAATLSQS
jgi:hypothetical protein